MFWVGFMAGLLASFIAVVVVGFFVYDRQG